MSTRQGKELITATRPFATEIRWKSWFYTLSTLFLLLVCNLVVFLVPFFPLRLACSIFSGLLVVRFFVIYHDFLHHSILYKSPLANLIFTLFGFYILAPKSIWKRSHDYHHNHNSKLFSASIGSYPIYSREKFLKASPAEQVSYLAVRHPLTIAFGYVTMFVYGMCIQSLSSNIKKHYDSAIALALHAVFIFSITWFFGLDTLILAVLLPFTLACALGAYLFYAQHNFPGVTFRKNAEWSYEHAALESSSYLVMNSFWRWVTANIGYHHIHHINSRIPFYRLPEAMENIPELRQAKTTTLSPRDIFRCLKLKIWDPELNRMIGVKEARLRREV